MRFVAQTSKRRRRARPRSLATVGLGLAVGLGLGQAHTGWASPPSGDPSAATPKAGAESAETERVPLATALDAALDESFLADAVVSVHVRDLETGKVLYDHNGERALNPASNVKLVTTAAALSLLGPEHRYPTSLAATEVKDGVIQGDLYLVGGGDPMFTTGDLYELANQLHARGIERIKGGIVVDATRFDGDGLPPGFDQKNELASYRAPTGACSLNFNTFEVHVGTAALGQPAHGAIDPPVPSIELRNETKIVEGRGNSVVVYVDERENKTVVTLKGERGIDLGRSLYRYPVTDPSRYAGETLRVLLRRLGVKVGRARVKTGAVPSKTDTLAVHRSDTLSVIARGVNKLSNNFMAEMVLHGLAPDDGGTAEQGLERVRSWWTSEKLPVDGMRYGNGSGLYDNNRFSAAQITALLARVHADFRVRSDYLASLSIAGTDGTTRRRMQESNAERWVRAKTGTLDGVSALSGYVGRPGRHPLAFSILFNDLGRWETGKARRVQDTIVVALADALDDGTVPAPTQE